MMDNHTEEQRHNNMSRIRSSSGPEELVRRYLFSQGMRFRKNDPRYAGKPDIVLPKYKTVIFINGCFWHQHKGCRKAAVPKSNTEYWIPKLNRNVQRDERNIKILSEEGWHVIVIWECMLAKDKIDETLSSLKENILQEAG